MINVTIDPEDLQENIKEQPDGKFMYVLNARTKNEIKITDVESRERCLESAQIKLTEYVHEMLSV